MDITKRNFFGEPDTSVDRSEVPAKKEQKLRVRCDDCRHAFVIGLFDLDLCECPKCHGIAIVER
jgi:Zn finger protein HypA/HybF involved in hydrogenase expression